MSAPEIITFGCRLNAYESEIMRQHAVTAGLTDTVIFNTCAVTAEAERQARQAIRKARRSRPGARIVVTGCAAQISPAAYAKMPEVDTVIGNDEKLRAASYFGLDGGARIAVNDIMQVRETAGHLVDGFGDRARAFVQVQNGCDHRCTFCIIPFGRGPSRSVPAGEVVTEIQKLVDQGYREVVLTGVDMTSYGPDLPGAPTLGHLVERILRLVPDLLRLRLSSVDSIEVDDRLFELIAGEARLMPHLHLSLQAGDDMILKRMKRRHSRQDAIDLCTRIREARPKMVFGADLIAGFPTETEIMFENTLRLVEECGLTYLHVFPYSARKGTPAARMPQLPKAVRKERAAILRAAGETAMARLFDRLDGQTRTVLAERTENGVNTGHTEEFAPVSIAATLPAGRLQKVTLTHQDNQLTGTCV